MPDDISEIEMVEGLALFLGGVDDMLWNDGLFSGTFGVGHCVSQELI